MLDLRSWKLRLTKLFIFILIFVESVYYTIRYMILLWTGSNPADIDRFRSYTGKKIFFYIKAKDYFLSDLSTFFMQYCSNNLLLAGFGGTSKDIKFHKKIFVEIKNLLHVGSVHSYPNLFLWIKSAYDPFALHYEIYLKSVSTLLLLPDYLFLYFCY